MMAHPSKCKLCEGAIWLDDEGYNLDTVWAYQIVEGKVRLAKKEIVLRVPLHYVHDECLEAARGPI